METEKTKKTDVEDNLKWHFFNLYCMALSDTDFDPREAEMLYTIGLEHGINKDTIDNIVVTSGLRPIIPENLDEKVAYLYDLTRMAWADGVIKPSERELLKKYIQRFGFDKNNIEEILSYFLTSVESRKTLNEILTEIKA